MATPETRRQLLAAVAACDDKKGEDTRILELDPADSGLADFFLITSASNDRQVVAIADEIEFRLKKDFGLYATSVEGRRQAEWILLDYVDIVIHVFLAEKRAFYDIERLRKSARPLTAAELESELKSALAKKTIAVRGASSKAPKKAAKVVAGKSPATKAAKPNSPSARTTPKGDTTVTAKPAKKAAKKASPKKAASQPSTKPVKATKAKSASIKTSSTKTALKTAPKPALKSAAQKAAPGKVGAIAPVIGKPFPANAGARPPILKCEDPDPKGPVDGVIASAQGAQPPIVKCEDPDESVQAADKSKAVSLAASAASKKAAKAPIKQAAKKPKK
jgi:ribosome-associated protein